MTAGTVPSICQLASYRSPSKVSYTASPDMLVKNQTYMKPAMSEIKFGKMRFLITDRPSEFALDNFVKELKRQKVNAVVRVCEPTYTAVLLKSHGIDLIDWEIPDGSHPTDEVIEHWLNLVQDYFATASVSPPPANSPVPVTKSNVLPGSVATEKTLAVHCVSGLGRAPLLVGIALLEAGMRCEDVIFLIRANRRGALTEKQREFLQNYKSAGKLRKLRLPAGIDNKERKSCEIM
jgi:protein tyrosine phosphatase type 4A